MNLRKLACKNIGHIVKFRDSGYETCDRCGSHLYYNEEEWWLSWHSPIYRLQAHLRSQLRRWLEERHHRRHLKDNDLPF